MKTQPYNKLEFPETPFQKSAFLLVKSMISRNAKGFTK
jgi:hypothetical protein